MIKSGNVTLPRITVTPVEAPSDLPPIVTKTAPNGEEMEFVLVGGGTFTMGNMETARLIKLDDFYIGKYEVTNEQFLGLLQRFGNAEIERFVEYSNGDLRSYVSRYIWLSDQLTIIADSEWDGGFLNQTFTIAPEYAERAEFPIKNVYWDGANLFCQLIGARLPTEAEWEKAARGVDGRNFPWGDLYIDGYANLNLSGLHTGPDKDDPEHVHYTVKVGTKTEDRSPYGAYDMAGNVAEWCADWWSESYYLEAPFENPKGPDLRWHSARTKVVRGGHYNIYGDKLFQATTYSRPEYPFGPGPGFRCACDP